MKALYRKYRPTKLTDVVGQEQVIKSLTESLERGKINHAYVFAGPRGTGKTSVARIFAHAVNKFDYQLEDDYLDIIEIDAASNNGVDNIRELREKAIIAPTKGEFKVYIIDEAHMLTKSAANALLKLLEEPPKHVIFIMATTEIDKIPITILSRTQVYNFSLAEPEVMLAHLAKIAKAENIQIDEGGLEVVRKRGGGSFRDSLSLLDQIATLSDGKITAETLEKALGVPSQEKIKDLLSSYQAGDSNAIQQNFKELLSNGLRAENIASELLSEIIAHPEPKNLPLLKSLPDVASPFAEAKLLLSLLEDSMGQKNIEKTPRVEPESNLAAKEVKSAENREVVKTSAEKRGETGVDSEAESKAEAETETSKKIAEVTNENLDTETAETVEASNVESTETTDFNWQSFIDKVGALSASTAKPLEKSKYELKDETLHIYPDNSFSARILGSPKHTKLLNQALPGYNLKVHDAGTASTKPKDQTIVKISAIMGDVQEIDGETPF